VAEQTIESGPTAGLTQSIARAATWWRDSVGEPLLSVLFPPRCVGCRDFETYLCDSCQQDLVEVGSGACPRCGEPGPHSLLAGRCSQCMSSHFSHSGVRSAYVHRGAARPLLAQFKFGGQPVLGRLMSDLARPTFTDYVSSIGPRETTLVTWVPAHRAARRKRGYNQAELLARALAAGPPPWPVADLVLKTAATKHQKELGRAGRQGNLRGAFALRSAAAPASLARYKTLVLVDDVFTTGATAQAVSSVLVEGTGLPVYVFTFSRAIGGRAEGHD
jgi:ComF family protein